MVLKVAIAIMCTNLRFFSTTAQWLQMSQHDLPWGDNDTATRQAALAEMLAQVSLQASQGETLDEVLKRIVDCIVGRMPVAIASIILLNDQGSHFVQEVYAGSMDLEPPETRPWSVGLGVAGRCARTGQAQLVKDVRIDPDYVTGNDAVRSEYLVPIRHRARLLGVLNLESADPGLFSPGACAMFDAVARQVAGSIHLARVVRELEQANRRLEAMSMSDGLTGIANRRSFDAALVEACRGQVHSRAPLSLLLIDVDYFKALNDACGHLFGDECLRQLARTCTEARRDESDAVARFGGEEFVLLLPACDSTQARRIAELLRRRVEALEIRHPDSAAADWLTVSIGGATVSADTTLLPEALLARADQALYRAKQQGRNRFVAAA